MNRTGTERPDALGNQVTLNDVKKVDAALAEIAWLQAEESRVRSLIEEARLGAIKKYSPLLLIKIGSVEVSTSSRLAYLTELVNDWAEDNLADNLPDGKKTLNLTYGSLSSKTQPSGVQNLDEMTDEQVLIAIDQRTNFVDRVRSAEEIQFGDFYLSDFVTLKASINRQRLNELIKSGKIDNVMLNQIGLSVTEPAEKVSFKAKSA